MSFRYELACKWFSTKKGSLHCDIAKWILCCFIGLPFILLLSWVFTTLIYSFVVVGALGTLTKTPSNAVGLLQDAVTFECASDLPFSIRWAYDSVVVSGDQCSSNSDNFVTSNRSDTECFLMVRPTTSRLSGPYSCIDGILPNAQAVLITVGQ